MVHGASGGVGLAAVQLAVAGGMRVIGTASSAAGKQAVLKAGAFAGAHVHAPSICAAPHPAPASSSVFAGRHSNNPRSTHPTVWLWHVCPAGGIDCALSPCRLEGILSGWQLTRWSVMVRQPMLPRAAPFAVLNHRDADYMAAVRGLTPDERGVDVIIEMLANHNIGADIKVRPSVGLTQHGSQQRRSQQSRRGAAVERFHPGCWRDWIPPNLRIPPHST